MTRTHAWLCCSCLSRQAELPNKVLWAVALRPEDENSEVRHDAVKAVGGVALMMRRHMCGGPPSRL